MRALGDNNKAEPTRPTRWLAVTSQRVPSGRTRRERSGQLLTLTFDAFRLLMESGLLGSQKRSPVLTFADLSGGCRGRRDARHWRLDEKSSPPRTQPREPKQAALVALPLGALASVATEVLRVSSWHLADQTSGC